VRRREFIALAAGAIGWPLAARAQQATMPVIGFMSGRSPDDSVHLVAAFHQGLREAGFVEGQNAAIEYRWARGDYGALPALAAELVGRGVNVLLGVGGSARAAKAATATIPIVFSVGFDPVAEGLVESFNRPGGNATGCTILSGQMEPKRLGLLQELVPLVSLYGCLLNPASAVALRHVQELEKAAQKTSKRIFFARASTDTELDEALRALIVEQVGALLVTADPYFDTRHRRIIEFAAQHRIPAIYHLREYALDGGLISYGPSVTDSYRQVGSYAGRILKGTKPGDLPVVQPTKFDLVINLKTAKALGIMVSAALYAAANEVIE